MKRKRHTTEQIISKLREAEVELAKGAKVPAACRKIGVTEQTFYRWRKQYSGMNREQIRRLKELEREHQRLRQAVSDLTLVKMVLAEAAKGNY